MRVAFLEGMVISFGGVSMYTITNINKNYDDSLHNISVRALELPQLYNSIV